MLCLFGSGLMLRQYILGLAIIEKKVFFYYFVILLNLCLVLCCMYVLWIHLIHILHWLISKYPFQIIDFLSFLNMRCRGCSFILRLRLLSGRDSLVNWVSFCTNALRTVKLNYDTCSLAPALALRCILLYYFLFDKAFIHFTVRRGRPR